MPADLPDADGIRAVPPGRLIAAVAVLLDVAISLWLGRFSVVGQDEPWTAAPADKLATEGTLGVGAVPMRA
jgi:hypothetical protein